MRIDPSRVTRYSIADLAQRGEGLQVPVFNPDADAVVVAVGDATATVAVAGGYGTLTAENVLHLMPRLGLYAVEVYEGYEPEDDPRPVYMVERVETRYTNPARLAAYGRANNDRFDDRARYPEQAVDAAIQQAEEAIERGTGRSVTRRAATVQLAPRLVNELPAVDVSGVECADGQAVTLLNGCQVAGVSAPTAARIEYGALLDAQIADAATRLAAWYLRPKAQAENARGTSMDGVYVSYDLATGADGSWTGLPTVDAAIEQHRSRRQVVG